MTAPIPGGYRAPVTFGVAMNRTFHPARPWSQFLAAAAIPTAVQTIGVVLTVVIGVPRFLLGFYAGTFSTLYVLMPALIVGSATAAGWIGTWVGAAVAQRVSTTSWRLWPAMVANRGVLIRTLPPWLLLGAVEWFAVASVGVWFESLKREIIADPDGRAVGGQILLAILFAPLAVAIINAVLQVRLFLFMPAAAHEKVEGFTAVGRTWQLTRGVGGTIFGYLAITGLSMAIIDSLIIAVVSGLWGRPTIDYANSIEPATFVGWAVAMAATQLPAVLVTAVSWVFSTVIYRLQAGLDVIELIVPPRFPSWYGPTPAPRQPPPPAPPMPPPPPPPASL